MKAITAARVEGLTVGTVVVVNLLKAGGTGAGVGLVAGETQVAAASIVATTTVPATYRSGKDITAHYMPDYYYYFVSNPSFQLILRQTMAEVIQQNYDNKMKNCSRR